MFGGPGAIAPFATGKQTPGIEATVLVVERCSSGWPSILSRCLGRRLALWPPQTGRLIRALLRHHEARCFQVVRHFIPFTLSMNPPQHHISPFLSPLQLQLHIPRLLLRNLHFIPTNFIVQHGKEMTLLFIISPFVLPPRIQVHVQQIKLIYNIHVRR